MLIKKFLATSCKVEFSLPIAAVSSLNPVYLVGDFNEWSESATLMQPLGDSFSVTLELPLGGEFQFRYLVNGVDWHNDWQADAYVPNGFGGGKFGGANLMGMYLVLVVIISFFVVLLIILNTSILANKDIPELLRELWRTYFGKDDTLSNDDKQNPSLKKDQ